MAVRDVIRRPRLEYHPDKVVLPPDTPSPITPSNSTDVFSSVVQDQEFLAGMLIDEMDRIDHVISAVTSVVSSATVVVDSQSHRVIGKTEIGMSDYLESLESSDPAAQMICEVYENHQAESGDPEALLLRPLSSARSRLSEAFSTLPSQIRNAFDSDTRYARKDLEEEFDKLGVAAAYPGTDIDPANVTPAQMQYIQRQIESAQELRAQIDRTADVVAQAINNDLWPALFKTEDIQEIQERALEFIAFLRKLRTVLMFGMLMQSKQWRSVTRILTNYVTNHIIRSQLNIIQGIYSECYNEIVAPVHSKIQDVISATEEFQAKPFLGKAGDQAESAAVAINTIAHTCSTIIESVTDQIADVLVIKEKQSSVELESVQVTTALLYQRRFIMLLDIVIEALQLASRQPVDFNSISIPPGKLASAISSVGQLPTIDESITQPLENARYMV